MVNEKYTEFKDSLTWACNLRFEHFAGPGSIRLIMVLNSRMDAQNVIKPCLDTLELASVIDNDKQVCSFSFYREDAKSKDLDSVWIIVTEVKL